MMTLRQYAALPYRIADGRMQFLLVRTLGGQRWIIPKGWSMKAHHPFTASREGLEEAGVHGLMQRPAIGVFRYTKRIRGQRLPVAALVFAIEVTGRLPHWPERTIRQSGWFSMREAVAAVQEPSLRALLLNFDNRQRSLKRRKRRVM